MTSKFSVYLSHQLEVLYQVLKTRLFNQQMDPFKKRFVVVYGPAMKNWLNLRLAQDPEIEIAMGIQWVYLNQIFNFLQQTEGKNRRIPSQLDLSLAIEYHIRKLFNDYKNLEQVEQKIWSSLLHYLKWNPSLQTLSYKMNRRITGLSQQLSKLFLQYGSFGTALLENWKLRKLDGWQSLLWEKLFGEKSLWTYPLKSLQECQPKLTNGEIHFFSISFLPRCEFDFLKRISQDIPIRYYLLSPCAVFWNDIKSDRENNRLKCFWQKKVGDSSPQLLQLEDFLRNRNPLLANFGRLGREMADQIDKSETLTSAYYLLPDSLKEWNEEYLHYDDLHFIPSSQAPTLLQAIQADILLMRNPNEESSIHLNSNDRSIQLHFTPSLRREIEILYNNLLALIDKDPSISSSDILVMAPQIERYVPYIQSQFGNENSHFDYQILDLGVTAQNQCVQAFFQLLDLTKSRWDPASLLEFFSNPHLLLRHNMSPSDVAKLKDWVERSDIRWGEDRLHCDELLKQRHCTYSMVERGPQGTWEYGIARLIMNLTQILHPSSDYPSMIPCQGLEFATSAQLNQWVELLHGLREDLKPLQDGTEMKIADWAEYLHCLIESYLSPDLNDSHSLNSFDELNSQLDTLRGSHFESHSPLLTFQSVYCYLQSLFERREIIYRENQIQSVKFCSLVPLRSIPAKIIALIGMEEGSFPRSHRDSSLNLMQGELKGDYSPSLTDYDRYLFLECVHSTQEYLLISCQNTNRQDGKTLQPSLIVEELFAYIDQYYRIDKDLPSRQCTFHHPFDSFNPTYFHQDSTLRSFSIDAFNASLLFKEEPKHPYFRFLDQFTQYDSHLPIKTCTVDLLTKLARNPIKFHLHHCLNIYMQTEENQLKSDEDFLLNHLERYKLKNSSLKTPLNKMLHYAKLEGRLPLGIFRTIAERKIEEEWTEIQRRMILHDIDQETHYVFEFSSGCSIPEQLDKNHWIFPSPRLKNVDGSEIRITGSLSNITSKGLIYSGKWSLNDVWKHWPGFLLYCYAVELCPKLFLPNIIPLEGRQSYPAFFEHPLVYLQDWIHYLSLCQNNFSPLYPDWISFIVKKDEEGLQTKFQQLFQSGPGSIPNHELRWILNAQALPDPKTLFLSWDSLTDCLVGPLHRNWFAKPPSLEED